MAEPVAKTAGLLIRSSTGAGDDNFLEFTTAPAAVVAPANRARLRFNLAGGVLEVSINGGAWTPIGGGGGAGDYVGKFEQAAVPTVLQIPDGKWGFWWDTNLLQMWIVRNRGGTQYLVEMTS